MGKINRNEIVDEARRLLRIDTAIDEVPNEYVGKIMPVIELNRHKIKVIQINDTAANDSDKTVSVPTGKQYRLLYGLATLATTATVGNRAVRLDIQDPNSNVLYRITTSANQAASTTEFYNFGSFGDVAETSGDNHTFPVPDLLYLPEGFSIRVYDLNAIDAAADDLTIRLIVEETDYFDRGH